MTVYYAPKHISGDYVLTQDTICSDGNTHLVSVERYSHPGTTAIMGYMFLVRMEDGSKRTNYRLYKNVQGAIKAAARANLGE